jgi:poly-gamma-glutamate synthase PgsB/CapB
VLLGKKLGQIPLRIAVTGTRGKSSVVRLIAACLKDSRMLVFAKTTGSKPCLIFPDGEEEEIRRPGLPTILEGKKALKKASRWGVHATVLEMMSIRPEVLRMETMQLTKPHILVITNIREDHVEEMGKSKEEIASCFASAIPKRSTVFIPEEECYPVLQRKAEKAAARLVLVPPGSSPARGKRMPAGAFERDYRLALAVAGFLGIDREKAYYAALRAVPDFGGLKIWRAKEESPVCGWFFVSAFAANDPQSTEDALAKVEKADLFKGRKRIALLNLRRDRGGRTMQWYDALKEEDGCAFDRLILVGEHAPALEKKLRHQVKAAISVFKEKKPEDLIAHIAATEKHESVVFGMGNMGGIGRSLVEYWEGLGTRHDV